MARGAPGWEGFTSTKPGDRRLRRSPGSNPVFSRRVLDAPRRVKRQKATTPSTMNPSNSPSARMSSVGKSL